MRMFTSMVAFFTNMPGLSVTTPEVNCHTTSPTVIEGMKLSMSCCSRIDQMKPMPTTPTAVPSTSQIGPSVLRR